jgi:hypothetical protein
MDRISDASNQNARLRGLLLALQEEYRVFSQKTSLACFQVIMPVAESFIYLNFAQISDTMRGAR